MRTKTRRGISTGLGALFLCGITFLPLVGCDDNDGPLEEVGEELDDAADEVEDAVDG